MMTHEPVDAQPSTTPVDFRAAAARVGIEPWQWEAAARRGLVPAADVRCRWSADVVDAARDRRDEIVATVGDQRPYGATRAAAELSERLGVEVAAGDIEALADAGHATRADEYKGYTLYDVAELRQLTAETVTAVVAERAAWIESSMTERAACNMLGWSSDELTRAIRERGIQPGADGRLRRADIAALSDDEALADAIASDRTLGPGQAATYLEIRPSDFRRLTDGGVISPVAHVPKQVGRWSTTMVPLYAIKDLDAARQLKRIPWQALRSAGPRQPSPLRGVIERRPDRSVSVRAFCDAVADRWPGIEVWATYQRGGALWRVDWTQLNGSTPDVDAVADMMADEPAMAGHAGSVRLCSDQGQAIRTARRMIRSPGYGAILDFETTDLHGYPVEVGIIDAHTGETLYEVLIRPPAEADMSPVAQELHGLSLAMLADSPEWPDIMPHIREALAGRELIAAYNASFDHRIFRTACQRYGIDPGPIGDRDMWWCAMYAQADYHGDHYRTALNGGHRAIGDCQATRHVIEDLTELPDGAYHATHGALLAAEEGATP